MVLKTMGCYRVLEKDKPISSWLQHLPLCEGLGRPGNKMKESADRMEKISSTIVLHTHVDGEDTIFATTTGPLVKNPLEECL